MSGTAQLFRRYRNKPSRDCVVSGALLWLVSVSDTRSATRDSSWTPTSAGREMSERDE